MLGHEELKTTKIYAHVTNIKISDEMKRLKEKIEDKNKTQIDVEFDKLSIEQQMKLFNIKLSMLDMETTQELRDKTKNLWNCLNPEIKQALMENTNI